jgi:autotransporter-associated beta strand protein/probable HAF family extracellular repeat protein
MVVAAACLSSWPASAQLYNFVTLDNPALSPASGFTANGINNAGQVVGSYVSSGSSFIYSGGNYTNFNVPNPPATGTTANGINDSGQITGAMVADIRTTGIGFEYDGSTYAPLPIGNVNAGLHDAVGNGINNSGQIVGIYLNGSGFLYSGGSAGNYTRLQEPSASGDTIARGINNAGEIVGTYFNASVQGTQTHGFLYSGGNFTSIDVEANRTFITGINDSGQIVGYTASGHGFVSIGGNFITIDDPLASGFTRVNGINNAGQIVGDYNDAMGRPHAFLATPVNVNIDLRGFDQAAGSLTGGGTVTNSGAAAATLTTGIDGSSTTFTGTIQDGAGVLALTKAGGGTLALQAANTYSGGTTLSAGTLQIGNNAALGSGDLTMAVGTTLSFSNGDHSVANNIIISGDPIFNVASGTQTVTGIISDATGPAPAGIVEKQGVGRLVLSGANTYSGGTILQAGTLQAGIDSVFNVVGDPASGIVSSAIGTGTLTFDGGTLQAGGNFTLANAAQINSTGGTIDSNGSTLTYTGNVSNAPANVGGLTINDNTGTGVVILAGANTYSGGTTISAGVLRVTNSDPGNSSSVGTGTVKLNGGTFQAGANNLDFSNTFEINTSGGKIDTGVNTLTISGTIQNGNGTTGILTKNGAGNLILTGANTYTGGTAINAGTVTVGNDSALGTGDVSMAAGTTLGFANTGNFTLANNFIISGDPIFTTPTGTTQTITGIISDAALPAPAGIVEVNGGGTLALQGANTYSGGTTISGSGTTVVVSNSTPGTSSSVGTGAVTLDGGIFQADAFAPNLTFSNAFKVNTTGGTIDNNGTVLTLSGNITDGNGTTGQLAIMSSLFFGGTTVLSGINTYSGGTVVNGTTLQVTNNNALGTGDVTLDAGNFQSKLNTDLSISNNFKIGNTSGLGFLGFSVIDNNGGTLTLSGVISNGADDGAGHFASVTFSGPGTTVLTNDNTYTGGTTICFCSTLQLGNGGTTGSIVGDVANGGVLAFNRSDSAVAPYVFNGVVSDEIGSSGQVKQIGSGTVVLTGANTYSGGTTITAGTLVAAHQSAGTIDALGTGDITMNGGTLRSTVTGTFFNNLTFADGTSSTVAAAAGQTVTFDAASTFTLGNVASANATIGSLTDTGTVVVASGTVNFHADSTLVVAGGTLRDGGLLGLALNGITSTTVNAGATLDMNDQVNAIHDLMGAGTVLIGTNAASVLSLRVGNLNTGAFESVTFSGSIQGAGGIEVQAVDPLQGGQLVLTGNSTYTGGTTICGCAMLQLGDTTHTASIVGAVTNLGILDIVNADTSAITSINNNGGLTTFYNATSAASIAITNRNGGETDFLDQSTAGSATIVNRYIGFTTFNNSSSADHASITNRFGGTTYFYDQSSAGSATIVNRYNGITVFVNSSSADNAGITNRLGGSTVFFDSSTAGNATIVNGSSGVYLHPFFPAVGLGFFEESTAGTATIINNNHGFIAFGSPFSFDTASADHANITNNAGSSLEFNGLTTAGNATITTLSGAAVAFFDGSTGGNAKFITNGTGWVDFSGSIGPGLDGRITAGSIAGTGTYYIGAGNTLITGSNNLSTEVSGVIADFNPSPPCGCPTFPGPGSLEKVGAGTFVLSGTNLYTGTTTVNGGILEVDGSIASSSLTTVNANAALIGTGTVGNTTIAGGGMFMPGNGTPGSFMTVAGNLAFQSGALYLVALDPSTSSLAKVTGTATLNGGTGAAFLAGNYVEKKYTILTATGGVSGTFTSFDTLNIPHGFKASLSYDANNVFLDLAIGFFAPGGLNQNQQNVSNALSKFFDSTGNIPIVFGTMTPAGLTQISGEPATGTQQATFDAMNLFLGLLTDPFIGGRDGGTFAGAGAAPFAEETAIAYAARKTNGARDALAKFPTKADVANNNLLENRWSVWGAAYGGGSTTDGNAALGSNNATARAFGFVAGADYRISPSTLAGFALAGGGTNFSVNGLAYGRSDMFQAGAFVRHNMGAAYVTGALAYGWQDVTTDRTVTVAGIDRLRAEFNANAVSGRIEGGYRYLTPWMGVTPYAAGQFTTYSLPAYAEQVLSGANTFALNYNAKDVTASRTEIGIRTDKSWAMANAILTLRGRLAWAHDFNTDRSITPVFQTLPGASFIVSGAAQAHDSALTTASAEMKWLNGWSAAATFEGQFSDVTRSYAGKGIVRYSW